MRDIGVALVALAFGFVTLTARADMDHDRYHHIRKDVAEPATLALLGMGAAAAGLAARRRRKQK